MIDEYLEGLNAAQRAAATHTDGPAIIIAGAGSGKTRVLTLRLAYLLSRRLASPFQLMALTFTNKAAKEMRRRIETLIGSDARSLPMGTFHSVFSRVLRIEADALGYTSSFSIYDEEDSESQIRTIVKELNLDDKRFKPRVIKNNISKAKNFLVSPSEFSARHIIDEFTETTAKVYHIYQNRLQRSNAMDFDDLLVNMVVLFNSRPDLLHKYQHKYRYLMIDEYQDTNHAQYVIAKKLAAVHENIVVVGDDSQSIYSFRGATIENILNFSKDYPDAKTYKLEQNYRSTSTIVEAANSVIENNVKRLPKNIFSLKEEGDLIGLIVGETEVQEAEKVVDSIREQKLRRNLNNKDFAILYRTNAQSRTLEDALRRASIPYKVFGGMSFYRRKEIKDAVAYLRLALNPYDEESIKRVINYPARGIGNTTMERLLQAAYENNLRLWDVILRSDRYLSGRSWSAVNAFAALITSFQNAALNTSAYLAAEYIIKASGMLEDLHQPKDFEMMDRYENVMEFLDGVKEFTENPDNEVRSLSAFLNEIALYTDADKDEESDDYVSLMTIHASKGLEFHSVFVVGMEEGLFPLSMSLDNRESLEEERRLCYVAMTRAKEKLTLSQAKRRMRYGNLEFTEPSRFLDEVNPKYIGTKTRSAAEKKPTIPVEPPRNLKALKPISAAATAPSENLGANTPDIAVGHTVEHDRFGRGIVVRLDGPPEDRRAVVDFPGRGEKTLLLRYAKLVVVQ